MKPNYSVELTVQDSGYFGSYTWTGQVQIYCNWRSNAVSKFSLTVLIIDQSNKSIYPHNFFFETKS